MNTIRYSANQKRQPLAKLALKGDAPPDLNTSTVAEMPPTVKRARGRPRKAPEDKAGTTFGFRIRDDRRGAYNREARACGQTITEWAIATLDERSGYRPELLPPAANSTP